MSLSRWAETTHKGKDVFHKEAIPLMDGTSHVINISNNSEATESNMPAESNEETIPLMLSHVVNISNNSEATTSNILAESNEETIPLMVSHVVNISNNSEARESNMPAESNESNSMDLKEMEAYELLKVWENGGYTEFRNLLHHRFGRHFVQKVGVRTLLELIREDKRNRGVKSNITAIIAKDGFQINKPKDYGRCQMHFTVKDCCRPALEALLEAGADPNGVNCEGDTPLHILLDRETLHWEWLDFLKQLIKADSNVINNIDSRGRTPFIVALVRKHREAVEWLLRCGLWLDVDVEYENKSARSMVEERYPDLIQLLPEPIPHVNQSQPTLQLLRNNENSFSELLKNEVYSENDDLLTAVIYNYTLLQHACIYNKKQAVDALLSCGADPHYIPPDNTFPPICLAAINNCTDIVQLLLTEGVDVNMAYEYGITALYLAVRHGHENTVKMIVEQKADVNIKSKYGDTALHVAAKKGDESVVKMLVEHGADVNLPERYGDTALHYAAQNRDASLVEMLVEHEADVNIINQYGDTALHEAAQEGDESVVKMLVEHLADVNITNKKGSTALHLAVESGNESVVKMLVEHNADVNITNNDGDTALHLAVKSGNESVVKMLVKRDADVNITNDMGYTALQYAVRYGNESVVKMLVERDADVNITDKHGGTALHLAVKSGNESKVKILVVHKADLNTTNKDGDIALHIAARKGDEKIMEILVKYGAKLNIRNKDGDTALHIAARKGDEKIVEILVKYGAKLSITDNRGHTAIHNAEYANNQEIVPFMLTNLKSSGKEVWHILRTFSYDTAEMYLDCQIFDRCYDNIEKYSVWLPFVTPRVTNGSNNVEHYEQRANNYVKKTGLNHSESRLLVDMMEDPKLRPLLTHPVLTSFALLKWQRVQVFFFVNAVFQLLFCLSLTGYIMIEHSSVNDNSKSCNSTGHDNITSSELSNTTPSPSTIALQITTGVLLGFVLLREVIQFVFKFKSHFKNLENWLEVLIITLSMYVVVEDCSVSCSLDSQSHNYFCPQVNAAVNLLAWCDFILLVSRHPSFSVYIEMFQKVAKTFFFLLWRFIIILFAFALSFYILKLQSDENVFNIWMSFLKTFVMLTGEFNSNDLVFETYTVTATVIFGLFVYFIAIVLMSLLNALAINDTQEIRKDAYLYSCMARVKFISLFDEIFLEDNAFVAFFSQFECGKKFIIFLQKKITVITIGHLRLIDLEVSGSKTILVVRKDDRFAYTQGQAEPPKSIVNSDLSNTEVNDIVSYFRNIAAKRSQDQDKKKSLVTENGKQTFNNSNNKCEQEPSALTQNIEKLLTICTDLQQRVQKVEDRSTSTEQRLDSIYTGFKQHFDDRLTDLEQLITQFVSENRTKK